MKQKDIALIIVIAAIAGIISFFVSQSLFVSGASRKQQAEVVPSISTTFTQPSTKYFNSSSIDPTQTIQIGTNSNPAPFSGSSQ